MLLSETAKQLCVTSLPWGLYQYNMLPMGIKPATDIFQQQMGTLFFDVASREEVIPFLGHPARTSLSSAKIALRIDALVVPYFAIRQPDGLTFKVEIEEPIAHTNPRDMLIEMNARLEAQIARNPAQWFWVHRRWK